MKTLKSGQATPNQTSKFEVQIEGGDVIFSKLATGRFPSDGDVENICTQIAKML